MHKEIFAKGLMADSKNSFAKLEENLAYSFKDANLLKEALTHPSNNLSYSNQRLEFFGDSIVSMIISERIYRDNPNMDEGRLSSLRAALTSGDYMQTLAKKLDIAKYLILNNPIDAERIRREKSSVADAFESIMGAIYLDSNFDEIKRVILGIYKIEDINIESLLLEQNPRGALQELAAKNKENLEYVLVEEAGMDHEKTFRYEVHFRNKVVSGNFCSSKRKAEADAALNMLNQLSTKL